MKAVVVLLLVLSLLSPVSAVTGEVVVSAEAKPANFLTEFDITFWQTAPFAALWTYFGERLIFAGQPVHWDAIGLIGTAVSAGNALIRANKVVNDRNWRSY
ncbi:MAG: hypothetical protein ABIH56_07195 [Candidatus Margulisiibacteriota bacterium]